MEPDDFLFEQQDYSYEARYDPPPTPWWDIRARWGLMSGAHRTNFVLYALGAVSLALLMLELTAGENNPDLEAAGRVVPVASSTSTSRPVATTSTRPSSTTTSVKPPSTTTAAATIATTRRAVTTVAQSAPVAADEEPPPADPGPEPTDPPQPTPQPTPTAPPTPAPTSGVTTTQPPVTEPERPPVTLSAEHCQLLTQYGQTHPSCP